MVPSVTATRSTRGVPTGPATGPATDPATEPVLEGLRLVTRAMRPLAQQAAGDPAARSRVQFLHVLARLGECRGGDLAAALLVDPSVISRQLAGLVSAGLVQRRPDPGDARAALVAVSAHGKQLLGDWHDAATALLHERLVDWSDDDLAAAGELLRRLAADLATDPTTDPTTHPATDPTRVRTTRGHR